MIFSSFKALRVEVNLFSFSSPTDQGELAMQRGLGRGFQGADAGSAHSPLAFPHERLHQDAMK